MRRMFAPAALAAIVLSIAPALALADDADTDGSDYNSPITAPDSTVFDLGVDISGVPHTAAAVHSFISGLEPQSQSAVMDACEHYMVAPSSAQSIDTLGFCQTAVRG